MKAPIPMLELPWKNNEPNISRIPAGTYKWRLENKVFKIFIDNVPGRSGIQIHKGNFLKDTKGCILPGATWYYHPDHGMAVSNSRRITWLLVSLLWQTGLRCGTLNVVDTV